MCTRPGDFLSEFPIRKCCGRKSAHICIEAQWSIYSVAVSCHALGPCVGRRWSPCGIEIFRVISTTWRADVAVSCPVTERLRAFIFFNKFPYNFSRISRFLCSFGCMTVLRVLVPFSPCQVLSFIQRLNCFVVFKHVRRFFPATFLWCFCLPGMLIHIYQRGVHSKYEEGGAFKTNDHVCIYLCTPLSMILNALPCIYPWNSGPIQWARGGVGLKPSAATRPVLLCLKRCENCSNSTTGRARTGKSSTEHGSHRKLPSTVCISQCN